MNKFSKVLVSMWVYEGDRDFIKIEAAKTKKLMSDVIHDALVNKMH